MMIASEEVDITAVIRLEKEIKDLDEKIKSSIYLNNRIFTPNSYLYVNYLEYIRHQKLRELNVLKDILKNKGIE